MDALAVGLDTGRVNWVLDADIRSFFDRIDQTWLIKFLEHRIGDIRAHLPISRLVRKWFKAGVLDEGEMSLSDTGTPQGAVISPLLANVFLHYVFDLWAVQWRRREAKGRVIVVPGSRSGPFGAQADDIKAGFELETDAKRFWQAMSERLAKFGLELHGGKTRLL
jgi:RNA-directed DNA polymerase